MLPYKHAVLCLSFLALLPQVSLALPHVFMDLWTLSQQCRARSSPSSQKLRSSLFLVEDA